jgi:sugar lactone lactonase YvrE
MSQSVELALDTLGDFGEGPIWDAKRQVLYWVDLNTHELHIYDPVSGHDRAIDVGQRVGTVVPRRSGGVMLGMHHGFASLDLGTEQFEIIADPERHLPGHSFNDGKCDPAGRFWAGTMDFTDWKTGVCSLYRLDPDLSVHKMLEDVTCSNGIAWSLDGKTMYYIDSNWTLDVRHVDAFDYDIETGEIENRRVACHIPKEMGLPDGMTIDSEGMLWVALYGSSKVTRWDPETGRLVEAVSLPVSKVTACAFGGPNLDQLYITSSRNWLEAEELEKWPLSGGLFRADVGVAGVPAFEFAG